MRNSFDSTHATSQRVRLRFAISAFARSVKHMKHVWRWMLSCLRAEWPGFEQRGFGLLLPALLFFASCVATVLRSTRLSGRAASGWRRRACSTEMMGRRGMERAASILVWFARSDLKYELWIF